MSPRVKCLALLALLAVSFAAVSSAARPEPASRGAASTSLTQPQPQPQRRLRRRWRRGGGGGGVLDATNPRGSPRLHLHPESPALRSLFSFFFYFSFLNLFFISGNFLFPNSCFFFVRVKGIKSI
ncbi:hypothetical protein BT93_L3483 [Corymbia citriodora subsp. variegata]|uniref:Uncharacterized protein n=1 Tax=Corymbia citriodora subsp. variegata TaxID=360336 RepID=A0A8T0CVY6_CORYI|nr:hypothetical protein BT93_L3483 [Corymbia citriodora subsp. variegata]